MVAIIPSNVKHFKQNGVDLRALLIKSNKIVEAVSEKMLRKSI